MKFQFTAIDQGGRVRRGVLRAEDEDDAREKLLADDIVPKELGPADEDEKVTWAPKSRYKARQATPETWNQPRKESEARPVAAAYQTTAFTGFSGITNGEAGLTEDRDFVFVPAGGEETLRLAPEELELALVTGFPRRLLRLTLLSGKMYEFAAGMIFTTPEAKEIARTLSRQIRKEA
jgi:hypothetical protein